jgi:hypothetical protein
VKPVSVVSVKAVNSSPVTEKVVGALSELGPGMIAARAAKAIIAVARKPEIKYKIFI